MAAGARDGQLYEVKHGSLIQKFTLVELFLLVYFFCKQVLSLHRLTRADFAA